LAEGEDAGSHREKKKDKSVPLDSANSLRGTSEAPEKESGKGWTSGRVAIKFSNIAQGLSGAKKDN